MRILHIINSFEGGGAERLTLQLHEMSLQQGIDSHAVSLMRSSAGALANTHCLNFHSPYQLAVPFKLYSFLSQPQWQDLDIIHVHLFPAQFFTFVVSRALNLKASLVTTEHNTFNYRRSIWYGRLVDKIFYSFYKKVICISCGTANALLDWQPQLINKLTVIYNGINLKEFVDNYQLNYKEKTCVIISVGRLTEQKNYETAIRALSKVSNHAFEYWIVGSGILEPHLKELVNSLDLESKVKFLGFRKDVSELLHQADIFLQTSLWEGFGLAVVEAMAAGLPVIVSNVPGIREVVLEELAELPKVGLLIDPLSEDDVAKSLNKLLEEPNLRLEMGSNAKLRASRFNIEQTVKEYIDLYNIVCQTTKYHSEMSGVKK